VQDDALRMHFSKFGEIDSYERKNGEIAILKFKERKAGEKALADDKDIPGIGIISLGWASSDPTVQLNSNLETEPPTVKEYTRHSSDEGLEEEETSWNR